MFTTQYTQNERSKCANVLHKVWTEMQTTRKYGVCVPYVDKFKMEMDIDLKKLSRGRCGNFILLDAFLHANHIPPWSYLHDRTHSVKIDKIMSEEKSIYMQYPRDQYFVKSSNIFINDIPKIKSLTEITTSRTIYSDNVQLLFSGTLNNLEQLKIYAETSLKTMKERYSENGLNMN